MKTVNDSLNGIDGLFHLALQLREEGRLDEAAYCLRKQLSLVPRHLEACLQLGDVLFCLGRRAEALELYRDTLDHTEETARAFAHAQGKCPADPEALGQLACTLFRQGAFPAAEVCFRTLTLYRPGEAHLYGCLALALGAQGKISEAIVAHRQALELDPTNADEWYNLGLALTEADELVQAAVSYRQALVVAPSMIEAETNLGAVCLHLGCHAEASAMFDRVLARAPDNAEALFNRGWLQLLQGDLANGFSGYEYRFSKSDPVRRRDLTQPAWDGSPLAGRTILLYAEQGLGDAIQFIRYLPLVAQRGGRVIVQCQPALKRLFAAIPGVERVMANHEPLPPFDLHAPLLTLPHLFGTTLDTIPCRVPYLSADQGLVEQWRKRVTDDDSLKVGLVWGGRQDSGLYRKRSIPLAQLAPLARVPGIAWYSLQLGESATEAASPPEGMTLNDLTPQIIDFADTAAVIANLDLVISIDTSVAHLAGALGKSTWILLSFAADWRWLLNRDDNPWYPTARLFRQRHYNDWRGVIEAVSSALQEFAAAANRDHPSTELSRTRVGTLQKAESSPSTAEDLAQRGMEFQAAGQEEAALSCFQQLLLARPEFLPGYLYLGDALHRLSRFAEAVTVYDQALSLNPDFASAHNNRGNALLELGRNDEAIASYRRMLRLRPEYATAHVTIATALQAMGRPEEAIANCRQALEITPDCAEAHWNLALALLQRGEYPQGWREFEWRWRKDDFPSPRRNFPQPLWDGSRLDGRTILLHAEQGLGDAIQFARYAPLVARNGGTVLIECPPPLKDLFQSIADISGVVAVGEPLPPFDLHAPFMSLPGIMGTTIETIPRQVPYLAPSSAKIRQWRERLGRSEGVRVGLVWAGNKRHINDRSRSCPLRHFLPLFGIADVAWYSLQVGEPANELTQLPGSAPIFDLTSHVAGFADTAGLIANLDLVIAVDTAVAHLAGALAVPVWTLHACAADWRWLMDRDDSPWYPTMRLFRQRSPGDWPEVLDRLGRSLAEFARSASN